MINRLRSTNREQRKLLYSLSTGFLTRIPGALGVLWFLPMLRFGLGTDDYAQLLAAMALGAAAGFLSGGFNYVGRRMIGEAYSNNDHAAEADGLASLVCAQMTALCFTLTIIAGYCWLRDAGTAFFLIAMFTAMIPIIGQFDEVRAAYNELYISGMLFCGIQLTSYALVLVVPATRHNIVLGALVIVGPYLLSSMTSCALLLRGRRYLLTGRPIAVWMVIRRGTMLAMADGFMMATLSLSVVWLQTSATVSTAAWYATIVRLFQIFLVPVVLLLFPLSSYIRILWNRKTVSQQQTFTKLTLLMGIGYGALVSIALVAVSKLYVGWLLHLPAPADLLSVSPVFLLFGAIVAYKTYSQIAYVVLNESVHLSSWTTVAVTTGVVFGAAASLAVDPMGAIGIYALVVGLTTIVILSWNAMRSIRLIPLQS